MTVNKALPILCSTDVAHSLTYYTDVLGFKHRWEWETQSSFGGVVKDEVELFSCLKSQGHLALDHGRRCG